MASLTIALLAAADDSNSLDYYRTIVDPMNAYARAYAVDTPLRLAHFLAQIGHESGFRAAEENGNYSATRMREVFGCRGGPRQYDRGADECVAGPGERLRPRLWTDAGTYAHNPRNLLSYVYALRMGNGDELSGDGFRYRGRGLVQLTGRDNYRGFTRRHNERNPDDPQDFVANPDLLVSELKYAVESAFYFWDENDINSVADTDDVVAVTRAVNGGVNGLEDRRNRLARIKAAMA